MAITISTGTSFSIAKTYGPVVTMSAITNANPAVATLGAGHAVVVGDFLEVTSGWGRLNNRIVRVSAVSTNDITFEGINTSSTTLFPAGLGVGSIRRITAWDPIMQIRGISVSGGDANFTDITAVDDVVEKQMPTSRKAIVLDLDIMDDTALAWYTTAVSAADTNTAAAIRAVFPNSSRMLGNAFWAVQRTPSVGKNEALMIKAQATFIADATRYAT